MSITLNGTTGISSTGGIAAADLTGTLPALDGAALTGVLKPASSLTAANLTGALPAIDGSSLTGIEAGPTYGTPVATTSGTAFDFTGIPAGVKEVTLHLVGINPTYDTFRVQLGTSSGFATTGYVSNAAKIVGSVASETSYTNQFPIKAFGIPASGRATFVRSTTTGNTWTQQHILGSAFGTAMGAGSVSLSGELTSLRLAGGTFSAGTANISWSS